MIDRRADDRILVSDTGNLPRPPCLEALGSDSQAFTAQLPSAVAEVVQHQIDIGMELVTDGEYVKRTRLVGRENVIAGTDCGLGTRVGHTEIAWGKLASAVEGARIASQKLWGRTP